MKIIDTYNSYKIKYKEYVVVIKSGMFYDVFNDDVAIMYSLFRYKIKNNGSNYLVGFPEKSIDKVKDVFKQNKINYIVLDKINENYEIVDKFRSNKNNYKNYNIDLMKIKYLTYKIDSIYNKLSEKILDKNIEKLIFDIEKLL